MSYFLYIYIFLFVSIGLLIEFMNMKVDCKVTKPSSNEISAMVCKNIF